MYKPPQGPKVVTRIIRPPRIAFIVGSIDQCEALIEICSLTWGGQNFCIVPYDPTKGLTQEWQRVLRVYDPDSVVSCVELDEASEENLIALTDRVYPGSKHGQGNRFEPWDPNNHRDAVFGQSIYSSLLGLGANAARDKFPPALAPQIPEGHQWSIYIKARYGYLNEQASWLILDKAHLKHELKLNDFIPVEHPEVGDNFLDFVLNHEPPFYWRHPEPITLTDYTLYGLGRRLEDRSIPDLASRAIVNDVQYLLVVSQSPSVEDFCWFWNLRVQRFLLPHIRLPLWLPVEIVQQRERDIAGLFANREGPFGIRRAFLLSKTVPPEQLQTLADELGEEIETATTELDRFYSDKYFIGIEDQQEVYFDKGTVRIPFPYTDVLQYCERPQYCEVDIQLPGYRLPRLNVASWGKWDFAYYRPSRTGLTFKRWGEPSERYLQLTVPTPWEILETFASIAGYSVELSDKGKIAERLVELIGGIGRSWVLSGRTVHKLLDQLAELSQAKEFKERLRRDIGATLRESPIEASIDQLEKRVVQALAEERHERVQQNYGQMKQTLGFNSKLATDFIGWLVKQRLLFRGSELACPVCGTRQWRTIDNISSTMQCVGCQQAVDTPLDVDSTNWRYRVNTLYAKAHELGVIPHLLTIGYYMNAVGQGSLGTDVIIGAFYGIKLKARSDAETPLDELEVDVAWIKDGELYIGECKTNGADLTADDVSHYFQMARSLRAKQIVFSALDDFSHVTADVQASLATPDVPIRLLTGIDLFDQFPSKVALSEHQPDIVSNPAAAFESAVKDFVDWLKSSKFG